MKVRIDLEEYKELLEIRFKQLFCKPPRYVGLNEFETQIERRDRLIKDTHKEIEKLKEGIKWRDDGIRDLEDEIDKKNEEIELLKAEKADLKETIKRMSQQLTEKELYEKKVKEYKERNIPIGERICRLEAHIEAQENPYFF